MVQICYSYILSYLWWCPHNMWDRLLIKCDWLLTLESKKQISLWHIYGSDQVSAMHPPPPLSSKLLWGGGGRERKKEWDRLLIKCDWLLILESKKQISLWHIYGSDQVSVMHPPPPLLQITWGGGERKKKTKEKKCVIYFVHVCTSKKTF